MTSPAGRPISPMIRAAVFVRSLEAARAFYEAIGLTEVYYEAALDPGSANAVFGTPASTATRCVILKRDGAPIIGMVGLFEVSNPQPRPVTRPGGDGPAIGETTLVFYVADLDVSLAAAEAAGGRRLTDPVLFEMPHRSQREVLLRDPDGVLVNFIERPPEEAFRVTTLATPGAQP